MFGSPDQPGIPRGPESLPAPGSARDRTADAGPWFVSRGRARLVAWGPRRCEGATWRVRMQWFTIGPAGLARMKDTTQRIKSAIGNREIAARVRGLPDDQLGALLNDVLS